MAYQGSEAKTCGVPDVIWEAIQSFVAKCEAEDELERTIIKFPKRRSSLRTQ